MGSLKASLCAFALLWAAPASSEPVLHWRAYVDEAATRFGLPAAWIEQVIRVESGGQTLIDGRPITSPAGAMGLMQLMPATWASMRGALGLGPDPQEPRANILAGSLYLRLMYDRFGYPGLFAAYNAGPGRFAEHLATGRPLPRETVAYVAAVGGRTSSQPVRGPTARAAQPTNAIFFRLRGPVPMASPASTAQQSPFVLLGQALTAANGDEPRGDAQARPPG